MTDLLLHNIFFPLLSLLTNFKLRQLLFFFDEENNFISNSPREKHTKKSYSQNLKKKDLQKSAWTITSKSLKGKDNDI